MKHFHFVGLEVFMILMLSPHLTNGVKDIPCNSLKIMFLSAADQLENCTVVLGNLVLAYSSVKKDYDPEEINKRKFPLREITGFFVVAFAYHLDSLGAMFPNLTVIRGRTLYRNYAFAIGNSDIKEITLSNLQIIGRGSVAIGGDNPRLCLPTKYDWDNVIQSGTFKLMSHLKSNNCSWMKSHLCHSCPGPAHDKCWHNGVCQRIEPFFRKLNSKFECHPLCVGGCIDPTSKGCHTCLDIKNEDECVEKCPENKVVHDNYRRCIEKSICEKIQWKIFEDRCVKDCPANFTSAVTEKERMEGKKDSSICLPCVKCPRGCSVPTIRHIADLEKMGRGCTQISGDLDINISEDMPHIMAELEEFLGDIEAIYGKLQIHRSPAITHLRFLKKLRLVKGYPSASSINIFENRNLQEIFDFTTMGSDMINVQNGSIRIHNNAMLCSGEVRMFVNKMKRKVHVQDYIRTNGKKRHCTDATIETKFYVVNHDTVAIRWKDALPEKHKYYSGFNIRYVPVDPSHTHDQVFTLRERDDCSIFGWEHKYVSRSELSETEDDFLETYLTGLQQLMTYDFVVETYQYSVDDPSVQERLNLDIELDGASSKPKRFRTEMNVPSRVQNFYSSEIGMTSIKFVWSILENEADGISFFYIDGVKQPFDAPKIDARDYCEIPVEKYETSINNKARPADTEESMHTELPKKDLKDDISPCCQQCCHIPKKQNTPDLPNSLVDSNLALLVDSDPDRPTRMSDRQRTFRKRLAPGLRETVIDELHPSTEYRFYIHVCASESRCSSYEALKLFTNIDLSLERVDLKIGSYYVKDQFLHVKFDEPLSNGPLTSYDVDIQRKISEARVEHNSYCITRMRHEANDFIFFTGPLQIGKYAFRVKANSLARQGPFTELREFEVFKSTVLDSEVPSTVWEVMFIFLLLIIVIIAIVVLYLTRKQPHGALNFLRNPTSFLRRLRRPNQPDDRNRLIDDNISIDMDEIELNDLRSRRRLSVIAEHNDN